MSNISIDTMRCDISKAYSSRTWKSRVNNMSDKQVFAVWQRFNCDGVLSKSKTDKMSYAKKPTKSKPFDRTPNSQKHIEIYNALADEPMYEQMSLDNLIF